MGKGDGSHPDGGPRTLPQRGHLEDACRVGGRERTQREVGLSKDRWVGSPTSCCPSVPAGRLLPEAFGIRAYCPTTKSSGFFSFPPYPHFQDAGPPNVSHLNM